MHSSRSFFFRFSSARLVALVALALCPSVRVSAGDVVTRTYAGAPASSDGSVVTRDISAPSPPSPVPAAGVSSFAFALVPAIQFPPEDWAVSGLRINLLIGRHHDAQGLDIGLLGNETADDSEGIQIAGLFNRIGRSDGALQVAGILNRCGGDFYGLQAAGILNWTDGAVEGVQLSFANRATELSGVQIGLYNAIDRGTGVQIGLVNAARILEGLQIGLVNVIRESTVPFVPFVNFAF